MTLSGLGGYGGLGGLGGLGGFGSYSTICRWFLNNSWEPMTQYISPSELFSPVTVSYRTRTVIRTSDMHMFELLKRLSFLVFFTVTQGMYALGLLTSIIATILLICVLFREKTCRVLYVIGSMFLLSSKYTVFF